MSSATSSLESCALTTFTIFENLPKEIRLLIWEAALPAPRSRVVRIEERALPNEPLDALLHDEGVYRRYPRESRRKSAEDGYTMAARTNLPPPPILLANRESSSVASLFYKRSFRHSKEYLDRRLSQAHMFYKPSSGVSHPEEYHDHGLYFSPQLDTLYISYHTFLSDCEPDILSQLTNLAHDPDYQYLRDAVTGVENLAILVDTMALLDVRQQEPKVTYDSIHIPVIDYEDLIAQVLHAFGSVKHLTIVVKDYDPNWLKHRIMGEERLDLLPDVRLVDPLDVAEAHRLLGDEFHNWPVKVWNEEYDEIHESDPRCFLGCREPGRVNLWCEESAVNLDRLEMFRMKMEQEAEDEGEAVTWKIPRIDYKVAIPLFDMDFKDWINEWLSRLLESEWDPARHWTSRNRNQAYPQFPFVGSEKEYADFMYPDTNGGLTKLLTDFFARDVQIWSSDPPTYHLEVKSTSESCNEPFHMSNNQVDKARGWTMSLDKHIVPKNVYVVIRVYNLDKETTPGFTIYVDPWAMYLARELDFLARENYSVIPKE